MGTKIEVRFDKISLKESRMKFLHFTLGIYDKKRGNDPYEMFGDMVTIIPKPWTSIQNHLLRCLCHVHVKPEFNASASIPFKNIWYKSVVEKWIDLGEDTCVLFNAHYYSLFDEKFVNYLHDLSKNVFIVIYLSDKFEFYESHYKNFPSSEQLKRTYDMVITYNVSDSDKYGFVLERPAFKYLDNSIKFEEELQSDVFFVGREKGRLNDIINIYEQCTSAGLSCSFYITEVPESDMKYRSHIHYNKPMSYSEVLRRSKSTKCIVNLVQDSGAGVSLRDYEAFGYQKFLLTNNYALSKTELYDPSQVIWIEDLPKRACEIAEGYNVQRQLTEAFSWENYYKWIQDELRGGIR